MNVEVAQAQQEDALEKTLLNKYIILTKLVEELSTRIFELEDIVESLDSNIDSAEAEGLDIEAIDNLCKTRNSVDLERVNLSLQKNKFEKEILEHQKISLLSK